MTAQRPALADVLAVLTGAPVADVLAVDARGAQVSRGLRDAPRARSWAHATPVEALAALVEAELLPEHWADEGRAPRWWDGGYECDVCHREGGGRRYEGCFCDEANTVDAPPSLPSLVAVASLSVDTIARAEAIVAETWPGARLVWRVESAAKLSALRIAQLFNRDAPEAVVAACSIDASGVLHNAARAAARARGVDHRPIEALAALGLHLVALDAGRVVLAVEALGG